MDRNNRAFANYPSFSWATSEKPATSKFTLPRSACTILPDPSASVTNAFGLITPRTSLETSRPSIVFQPIPGKATSCDDFKVPDPIVEEQSCTPQAISLTSNPHTPPLTPPHHRSSELNLLKQPQIPPHTLAQIRLFFNRKSCSEPSLHLHGITGAMLQELDDMEEAGELNGGNIRYVAKFPSVNLPI